MAEEFYPKRPLVRLFTFEIVSRISSKTNVGGGLLYFMNGISSRRSEDGEVDEKEEVEKGRLTQSVWPILSHKVCWGTSKAIESY